MTNAIQNREIAIIIIAKTQRILKRPTLQMFNRLALMLVYVASLQFAGPAFSLPRAQQSDVEVTKISGPQDIKRVAREFRSALDARVKLETSRRPIQLFAHIDDLIERFVRPGMTMHDAEGLMRAAGLRLSTIDLNNRDGTVLYFLDYPRPPFFKSIAVISIYPAASHQSPATVLKAKAQINNTSL